MLTGKLSPLLSALSHTDDLAFRGRILCATGYALISDPGQGVNDVPEIVPEKTNVSFIPTDGTPELRLLVNGEPEQVDEVRQYKLLLVVEDVC